MNNEETLARLVTNLDKNYPDANLASCEVITEGLGRILASARITASEIMDASASTMLDAIDSRLPKDSQMLKVHARYVKDAAEHLEIAELLGKGDLESAAKAARRLDSVGRDLMPKSVWDFLRKFTEV